MYCGKCGALLADPEKKCPHCGADPYKEDSLFSEEDYLYVCHAAKVMNAECIMFIILSWTVVLPITFLPTAFLFVILSLIVSHTAHKTGAFLAKHVYVAEAAKSYQTEKYMHFHCVLLGLYIFTAGLIVSLYLGFPSFFYSYWFIFFCVVYLCIVLLLLYCQIYCLRRFWSVGKAMQELKVNYLKNNHVSNKNQRVNLKIILLVLLPVFLSLAVFIYIFVYMSFRNI